VFKKSLVLAPSQQSDRLVLQNVYISLPYIMVARTAGIEKNSRNYVTVNLCIALLWSAWYPGWAGRITIALYRATQHYCAAGTFKRSGAKVRPEYTVWRGWL